MQSVRIFFSSILLKRQSIVHFEIVRRIICFVCHIFIKKMIFYVWMCGIEHHRSRLCVLIYYTLISTQPVSSLSPRRHTFARARAHVCVCGRRAKKRQGEKVREKWGISSNTLFWKKRWLIKKSIVFLLGLHVNKSKFRRKFTLKTLINNWNKNENLN